jgi:hypothetical protein
VLESLGSNPDAKLREPLYLFAPHAATPLSLHGEGSETPYGDAVITLPYIRQRWSQLFELLDVDLLVSDLYQVVLTMRKK